MFVFPNRNPNKGVIINKPNGTNVYSGVPKDYTKQVMYAQALIEPLHNSHSRFYPSAYFITQQKSYTGL